MRTQRSTNRPCSRARPQRREIDDLTRQPACYGIADPKMLTLSDLQQSDRLYTDLLETHPELETALQKALARVPGDHDAFAARRFAVLATLLGAPRR